MSLTAVFFDLDGTLTDPAVGISRCLRHALCELGVGPPSDRALRHFIGPPLAEIFEELLEAPSPSDIDRAVHLYRERYDATGLFENAPIPGVDSLLHGVRELGAPAYVVTSKRERSAQRVVEHFSLAPFFRGVFGSRPDRGSDQKRALIARVLGGESIDPDDAIMVGDRHHDIEGARACGIDSIGVTWGFGSRRELEEAGADWICDDPEDLLRTLRSRSKPPPHLRRVT